MGEEAEESDVEPLPTSLPHPASPKGEEKEGEEKKGEEKKTFLLTIKINAMKLIYCVLIMLCPFVSKGQGGIKALQVGDVLPPAALKNIINSSAEISNISEFKGKLLIIDFWASWCGACLKGIVRLDSLKEVYGEDLQVLLVNTHDGREKAIATLAKLKGGNSNPISFGSLVKDSLLKKYFPHNIIPHYVWLDENKKLVGITDSEAITAENIASILNDKKTMMVQKTDVLDYKKEVGLLENDNGGMGDRLLYKSVFTGYLAGLATGVRRWQDNSRKKITYLNHDILYLYQQCLGFEGNRVIQEHKLGYTRWNKAVAYCYEITMPLQTSNEAFKTIMLQDINRYLRLWGRMEEREVPCYEMTFMNHSLLPAPSENKPRKIINATTGMTDYTGTTLDKFCESLNTALLTEADNPIIVNGTGIHYAIDISISKEAIKGNIAALCNDLMDYGITLKPTRRIMEMFVLSDIK